METRITARLRDQLGTAKNANEMFRIFSRFNALFVRPHIRGAIREYQTQLIQRVKDDIEALHDKFKVKKLPSDDLFRIMMNYCGGFLVQTDIKTDIISLHVNVDDSNGQNKQIFVQLHFIALRSLSIFTFYSSGDFDSFLLYL